MGVKARRRAMLIAWVAGVAALWTLTSGTFSIPEVVGTLMKGAVIAVIAGTTLRWASTDCPRCGKPFAVRVTDRYRVYNPLTRHCLNCGRGLED